MTCSVISREICVTVMVFGKMLVTVIPVLIMLPQGPWEYISYSEEDGMFVISGVHDRMFSDSVNVQGISLSLLFDAKILGRKVDDGFRETMKEGDDFLTV